MDWFLYDNGLRHERVNHLSPLMMNIRNLGSKGSVGVKYKDNISAELCLKLCFASDWYFVILLSQYCFESDCPKTKFQTITF